MIFRKGIGFSEVEWLDLEVLGAGGILFLLEIQFDLLDGLVEVPEAQVQLLLTLGADLPRLEELGLLRHRVLLHQLHELVFEVVLEELLAELFRHDLLRLGRPRHLVFALLAVELYDGVDVPLALLLQTRVGVLQILRLELQLLVLFAVPGFLRVEHLLQLADLQIVLDQVGLQLFDLLLQHEVARRETQNLLRFLVDLLEELGPPLLELVGLFVLELLDAQFQVLDDGRFLLEGFLLLLDLVARLSQVLAYPQFLLLLILLTISLLRFILRGFIPVVLRDFAQIELALSKAIFRILVATWSILRIILAIMIFPNRYTLFTKPSHVGLLSWLSLVVALVTRLLRFSECLKDSFERPARCHGLPIPVIRSRLGRGSRWLITQEVPAILYFILSKRVLLFQGVVPRMVYRNQLRS